MKSKIRKTLLLACLCVICFVGKAQTVIQMEEYGGVYRIPCKVNGAKMKLIFDTGAEKVCLSLSMANYLYDNDYITDEDIVGSGTSTVADGSIVDHIKIIIKDIEIEGVHLRNVEAVVIDGLNAPLLLGQSALKKLGQYTISGNKLVIGTNEIHSNQELSEEYIGQLLMEATSALNNDAYYIALEKYKILYDNNLLNALGKKDFADCYYYTDQKEEALEIYQSIQNEIESEFPQKKVSIYYQIGRCLYYLKSYGEVFPYMEKVKFYSEQWSKYQADAIWYIAISHYQKGNINKAQNIYDDYIKLYLTSKNYNPIDCWSENTHDNFLADLYYSRYLLSTTVDEKKKYIMISAKWGNMTAINECFKNQYYYLTEYVKYNYNE